MEITQKNYVQARNALIPDAVRAAIAETGRRPASPDGSAPDDEWGRAFLRHMDRLCVEHGVVVRDGLCGTGERSR